MPRNRRGMKNGGWIDISKNALASSRDRIDTRTRLESQEIFSTRERLRKHGFRMNNKKSWEHREWIQQACIKKRLDARNRMCRISCIEKKTVWNI